MDCERTARRMGVRVLRETVALASRRPALRAAAKRGRATGSTGYTRIPDYLIHPPGPTIAF